MLLGSGSRPATTAPSGGRRAIAARLLLLLLLLLLLGLGSVSPFTCSLRSPMLPRPPRDDVPAHCARYARGGALAASLSVRSQLIGGRSGLCVPRLRAVGEGVHATAAVAGLGHDEAVQRVPGHPLHVVTVVPHRAEQVACAAGVCGVRAHRALWE